jgi:dTDP-4-dehydrorhamnose reductase
VFDGRRGVPEPYIETDKTNPVSVYGQTKLDGEEAVRQTTERHVILRTSWLYGRHGQNFLKTMLKLALSQPEQTINVVNDQYGSPTWSWRLAHQVGTILQVGGSGTYHSTAEGFCSWYNFAKRFLEKMEIPHSLKSCTTAEYPTPAQRPANAILENKRLKKAGINDMMGWEEDLDTFVARYGQELKTEMRSTIS